MNSRIPGSDRGEKNAVTQSDTQKRSAKTIIVTMIAVIVAITVLFLSVAWIVAELEKPEEYKRPSYIFHEIDYDRNILEDETYLSLDRDIRFTDTDNGITVTVSREDLSGVPTEQHDHVLLLLDFIDYAINGNSEALNALFSDEYIEADGDLKMDFTMQQLYNIKITYASATSTVVDGYTHVSYDYWLEYMIRQNNGTFRSDMDSDCIRKEYVRVTERRNELGIDILAPYRTSTVPNSGISTGKLIALVAVPVLLIGSVVVGVVIIAKKTKIK